MKLYLHMFCTLSYIVHILVFIVYTGVRLSSQQNQEHIALELIMPLLDGEITDMVEGRNNFDEILIPCIISGTFWTYSPGPSQQLFLQAPGPALSIFMSSSDFMKAWWKGGGMVCQPVWDRNHTPHLKIQIRSLQW